MKTIVVTNLKGGEAKSTTVVNLAYELATTYKKRVLVIDTDQNMGATKMLLPAGKGRNTITAAILGLCEYPYDLIYKTAYEGLDIIPADVELAAYGTNSFARGDCKVEAINSLCVALAEDDAYDYIIADSAPGMAAAFVCAVAAADAIVIPMTLDALGISGMQDLAAQIKGVREVRPNVRIAGCLVTMLQRDAETSADMALLRSEANIPVYDTAIRWSPVVRRASKARVPAIVFSSRCAASLDYRAWVAEFIKREEALCK